MYTFNNNDNKKVGFMCQCHMKNALEKKKKQCISHQNKMPNLNSFWEKNTWKKRTTSCKDNHILLKTIPIAYSLTSFYWRNSPVMIFFDGKKKWWEFTNTYKVIKFYGNESSDQNTKKNWHVYILRGSHGKDIEENRISVSPFFEETETFHVAAKKRIYVSPMRFNDLSRTLTYVQLRE